jgi:hypothetical protein
MNGHIENIQSQWWFNRKLTDWLIEYNFHRPHEAIDYDTPINMTRVSPMYPSDTKELPFYFEMWFSFITQHGESAVVFDPSE